MVIVSAARSGATTSVDYVMPNNLAHTCVLDVKVLGNRPVVLAPDDHLLDLSPLLLCHRKVVLAVALGLRNSVGPRLVALSVVCAQPFGLLPRLLLGVLGGVVLLGGTLLLALKELDGILVNLLELRHILFHVLLDLLHCSLADLLHSSFVLFVFFPNFFIFFKM